MPLSKPRTMASATPTANTRSGLRPPTWRWVSTLDSTMAAMTAPTAGARTLIWSVDALGSTADVAVPESPLALRTTSRPSIAQARLATPHRPGRSGRSPPTPGLRGLAVRSAAPRTRDARTEASPRWPSRRPLPEPCARGTQCRVYYSLGGRVAHRGPGSPADWCSTWNMRWRMQTCKATLACVTAGALAPLDASVSRARHRRRRSATAPVSEDLLSPIASRRRPTLDVGRRRMRCGARPACGDAGRPAEHIDASGPRRPDGTTPMPLVETVSRETCRRLSEDGALVGRDAPRPQVPSRCACRQPTDQTNSCGQLADEPADKQR